MRSEILVGAAIAAGLFLGGCCAPPRYWRAKDLGSGRIFYTADTYDIPIAGLHGPVFVSSEGKLVGLASYELEAVDQLTFERESGATATAIRRYGRGCEAQIRVGAARPQQQ